MTLESYARRVIDEKLIIKAGIVLNDNYLCIKESGIYLNIDLFNFQFFE